jgi:predicted murein hydrolase (TIGR00659 family)
MMNTIITYLFGALLTLGTYAIGIYLYKRYKKTWMQPLIVATVLIGAMLVLTNIPYETYMKGANLWNWLLGPAVVALAYPLYFNLHMVRRYFGPILLGVLGGGLFGLFSGYLLTKWLGADADVSTSTIPKNATTPIAIELSEMVGGIPSLTVVYVMIAGIGGAVLGIPILDKMGIRHPVARGLSIGIASHGFGTAKLFESSDREGSVSTVAYILTAILITVVCTLFFS